MRLNRIAEANSTYHGAFMLACVADYRIAARRRLPRLAFDYLDGGAEDGDATRRNVDAYRQWLFKPRVLTDVSQCSLATRFFGRAAAAPLIVGPTGLNGLFWPRADELLAQAAGNAGLPFVLSTASTSLLEDVRAAAPGGDLWMQLYVSKDRRIAEDLMRRASAAGFATCRFTANAITTPATVSRCHCAFRRGSLPTASGIRAGAGRSRDMARHS
jgi:(S)-mandelate dehydrogenase